MSQSTLTLSLPRCLVCVVSFTVTMPDFEELGVVSLELASLISILLCPVVSEDQRASWEEYTRQHQNWLPENLAWHEKHMDPNWVQPANWSETWMTIHPSIVNLKGYDTAPGPYTPAWQSVPAMVRS
jgi:hypothetical protein